MKKYSLLFVALFVLIVSIIISNTTKISFDNTWFGNLFVIAFFTPLLMFSWKCANILKKKDYGFFSALIKFFIVLFIIGGVVAIILWLLGVK